MSVTSLILVPPGAEAKFPSLFNHGPIFICDFGAVYRFKGAKGGTAMSLLEQGIPSTYTAFVNDNFMAQRTRQYRFTHDGDVFVGDIPSDPDKYQLWFRTFEDQSLDNARLSYTLCGDDPWGEWEKWGNLYKLRQFLSS